MGEVENEEVKERRGRDPWQTFVFMGAPVTAQHRHCCCRLPAVGPAAAPMLYRNITSFVSDNIRVSCYRLEGDGWFAQCSAAQGIPTIESCSSANPGVDILKCKKLAARPRRA